MYSLLVSFVGNLSCTGHRPARRLPWRAFLYMETPPLCPFLSCDAYSRVDRVRKKSLTRLPLSHRLTRSHGAIFRDQIAGGQRFKQSDNTSTSESVLAAESAPALEEENPVALRAPSFSSSSGEITVFFTCSIISDVLPPYIKLLGGRCLTYIGTEGEPGCDPHQSRDIH